MKLSKLVALSITGLTIVSCGGQNKKAKDVKLGTKLDSVSYALGMTSSRQVKMIKEGLKKDFGLALNEPAYMLGFDNGVDSTSLKLNVDNSRKLLNSFFTNQRELVKKQKETNTKPVALPVSKDASLKTQMDSVSYALGVKNGLQVNFMKNNIKSGLDLDLNMNAFKTAYSNGADSLNIKISEADSKTLLDNFFKAKQEEVSQKNKKAGEDFLAENKKKENVKTTDSGLQYMILKEGTGKKPTTESKVKVHYHGTLIDGKVFDSSVNRNEPSEFGVTQVIKGWTEGLQLMKEGAKYRFFIPQNLAYGARPAGQFIKPYSTLIFDVELLEVKPADKK